jgi:hypothetical protein
MFRRLVTISNLAVATLVALPGVHARADESCRALISQKKRELPSGWAYNAELTMHSESNPSVSYSRGQLRSRGVGFETLGAFDQSFSDRRRGDGQPFDINQADQQFLTVSDTGLVRVQFRTWNFETTWDMSCKGSVLTTYAPGWGVITLTLRDQQVIVR